MRKFLFAPLLFAAALSADKAALPYLDEVKAPWLTGPIFAPSGITIPPGHYYIEPYFFLTANTAAYNRDWKPVKQETFWSAYFQPFYQMGLNSIMDFDITPTVYYNFTEHAANWAFGDLSAGIDIQLFQMGVKPTDWTTSIKIEFNETFPTGKYDNLKPIKLGTQVGGAGSYVTSFVLCWAQIVYVGRGHFFDTRLGLTYNVPTSVRVKGLNAYGGGKGTRGTVYPSQSFRTDLGMEFTLTQNWVLAMDVIGTWAGKTRFKGNPGTAPDGSPAKVGGGSSVQFQLAPAIEYNFNENIGIIGGYWFTLAGRNSQKFSSGVFVLSWYI